MLMQSKQIDHAIDDLASLISYVESLAVGTEHTRLDTALDGLYMAHRELEAAKDE